MPSSHQPRSADVARLAGVSRTTVSLVLNGRATAIPQVTQDKVWDAVSRLDYVPSAAARMLRRGRGRTILFLAPGWMPSSRADEMWEDISKTLEKRGLTCIFSRSAGVSTPLKSLLEEVPAGAVVPFVSLGGEDQEMLSRLGIPVISLFDPSDAEGNRSPFAAFQRRLGATQARHLLSTGCRTIAWLGTNDPLGQDLQRCRVEGVREELAPDSLSLTSRGDPGLDDEAMLATARRFAEAGVDGVCTFNDESAACLIHAMNRLGLSAPADMRVIGIDNDVLGRYITPSLTTVDYHDTAQGYGNLIADIYFGKPDAHDRIYDGSVEVVIRESA